MKLVKILLAGGAAIEATGTDGETALHMAARSGNEIVVAVLIEYGAQLEARAAAGTALKIALKDGHKETAKILVAAGAQTTVDRVGNAVLHRFGFK